MTGLGALIRRNSKLYFKDKGMFFTSLITPMILLVLYVTFLSRTYEGSFRSALAAAGAQVEDSLLHGCVGGQLISSLLAISCGSSPKIDKTIMPVPRASNEMSRTPDSDKKL